MATGTHITLQTTPFGQKLTNAVSIGRAFLNLIRELKGEADAITAGGAQTTNLEDVSIGIPAGSGGTIYTDIANVKALYDVATIISFLDQLG